MRGSTSRRMVRLRHASYMIKGMARERAREYFSRLNTGAVRRFGPGEHAGEIPPVRNRPWVNGILFLTTFLTTTFAGATDGETLGGMFVSGLHYSVTLLTILLFHEFGHYFAARRFGVGVTLPYFIPFPSIIGTMGAVIKTQSPIPHRRALFYIGAMGPLAGFAVSLGAVVWGVTLSEIRPIPPVTGDMLVPVFGDSILFGSIVTMIHGPMPPGSDIFLSPYAWAGWIGFLITSLNLVPIGQLDGSHILYALVGRRQLFAGWIAVAFLASLSFIWQGWLVWVLLTFLFLMVAHPEVPEGEPLSPVELIIGWGCMAILILTFVPVPVEFL